MIISIPRSSGKLKHHDNIHSIYSSSSSVLHLIEQFNPMYAGGFPMALLFAPRTKDNKSIVKNYYHDYDLYFQNHEDLQAATTLLNQKIEEEQYSGSVYETDNALTYKLNDNGNEVHLQIVKIVKGTPQEILSTFDFKNCAIGYSPLSSTMHFHYQAPSLHIDRKLDILEPWMLEDIENVVEANAIVQLMRFKKYCLRWNYSLSKSSFDKLYSLYKIKPDIRIQANQTYLVSNGPYDRQTYIGLAEQNVWQAIAPIMKDCHCWDDSLDIHKLITPQNELTYDEVLAPANAPIPF